MNARPGAEQPTTSYDAESARLSGGADIDTEHAGYTGGGFVDGFSTQGATATFEVEAPAKGSYDVGLRYANGPHPFTGTKTLGVSVNGGQAQQTALPFTGAWNRWSAKTERLALRKGRNTITYTYRAEDTGHVNLDMIEVRRPGSRIDLFSGGSVATAWQHTDGRSPDWPHTADNSIEVCCGDIRTKQAFGDFRMHAEFRVPSCRTMSPGRTAATAASTSRSGTRSRSWTVRRGETATTRPRPSTTRRRPTHRLHRTRDLADVRHRLPRGPFRRRGQEDR